MKIETIPYNACSGVQLKWEDNFHIKTEIVDYEQIVIKANNEGLLSLARHLLTLIESPVGTHIHLDRDNSLEDDSCELIFEKID